MHIEGSEVIGYRETEGVLEPRTLGDLLALMIHQSGKKYQEVAKELEISPSSLRDYVWDRRIPRLDRAVCLAEYFNTDIRFLSYFFSSGFSQESDLGGSAPDDPLEQVEGV